MSKVIVKTVQRRITKKDRRLPLVQLSLDEKILARQKNIVLTSQYPYPPFKEEYVFENDLVPLLKEQKKELKAFEKAAKAEKAAKQKKRKK